MTRRTTHWGCTRCTFTMVLVKSFRGTPLTPGGGPGGFVESELVENATFVLKTPGLVEILLKVPLGTIRTLWRRQHRLGAIPLYKNTDH